MTSRFSLAIVILLCLSIAFSVSKADLHHAFGDPQNFIRQEITDGNSDLIKLNPQAFTTRSTSDLLDTVARFSANDSIDIELATYSSDGSVLNATLWLKDFQPRPLVDAVEYGMFLDVNTDNKSDYQVTVSWDDDTKQWSRILKELSSAGDSSSSISSRPLEIQDMTDTLYSGNQTEYVTLHLNLDSIRSPDHLDAVFYANYLEEGFGQIDPTSLVRIPPPAVVITPASNPVFVRPGEEKSVSLKIESTPDVEPTVYLNTSSTSDLRIGFRDNDNEFNSTRKIQVPFSGIATIPLDIVVSKYAVPVTIVKSISADIAYPFRVDRLCECWTIGEAAESNRANYSSSIVKQRFNLVIEIQPPLTASDYVNNFWKSWGESLTGFYTLIAAVAGGISVMVAKRLKKT